LVLVVGQGLLIVAVGIVIKSVRCARVRLMVWMLGSGFFDRAMGLVCRLEERHGYALVVDGVKLRMSSGRTGKMVIQKDFWPEGRAEGSACQLSQRGLIIVRF